MSRFFDLVYGTLVLIGAVVFRITRRTPRSAYTAMRRLLAHGRVGFLARVDRWLSNPFIDGSAQQGIAQGEATEAEFALERDGLYLFKVRLPEPLLEQLFEHAQTRPCSPVSDRSRSDHSPVLINEVEPTHPRYDFSELELLRNRAVQELLCDGSLTEIAGRYLQAQPLVDIVSMWWSFHVDGPPDSAAAQMFHCDRDRLRFVKLFVYLTDVAGQSGPHVFVRGTHKRKLPARLRRDGRYTDAEVNAAAADDILEISGPKGTMFLADTSALHKGAAVLDGRRLVFQIEWATNLFGAPYPAYEAGAVDASIRDVLALELRA